MYLKDSWLTGQNSLPWHTGENIVRNVILLICSFVNSAHLGIVLRVTQEVQFIFSSVRIIFLLEINFVSMPNRP